MTRAWYIPGPPLKYVEVHFDTEVAVHGVNGWATKGSHGQPAPIVTSVKVAPTVIRLTIGSGLWMEPVSTLAYNALAGSMTDVHGRPLKSFLATPLPIA